MSLHDNQITLHENIPCVIVGPRQSSSRRDRRPVLYEATANLVIPASGHSVLVQAGPKKTTTTHTLRLEFNLTALGASGIAYLKTELEALVLDGLSFTDVVVNGKVTRIDIAVDIVGVHLADLLMSVKSGGKQHWYFSAEGKPEMGYIGIKPLEKSAKWTAYNKRQQLKDMTRSSLRIALLHRRTGVCLTQGWNIERPQ